MTLEIYKNINNKMFLYTEKQPPPGVCTEISNYLKEMRITPSGDAHGFPNYRVGSRLNREEASSKLCDIAGDMLMVFDVDPTPVIPRGNSRLEFANQIGIFYIDDVVSNSKPAG